MRAPSQCAPLARWQSATGLLSCWLAVSLAIAQLPVRGEARAGELAVSNWPSAPVRARHAMVVTDEELASRVGLDILRQGGNAVDAAVAVAFALAVVQPAAGNIGGGGFMLVRMADGRAGFVDYRETAPGRATAEMYIGPDGQRDAQAATLGYRAVSVPGTVAGMELALRTYGTLSWEAVLAPAIRLAEEGFPVSEKLARLLRAARPRLQQFALSRRIFLAEGALYRPGDHLRQPELAATLRRIARAGAREFYRGETARALAEEMARMGGLITREDLAGYQAKLRVPLRATYRFSGEEWEVIAATPPSSGGVAIIEMLNILEPVELTSWDDPRSVHWVVEAMRRAFADRAHYLADMDFVPVPVRGLTDPRYAAVRRATIDPERASTSRQIGPGRPAEFDADGHGAQPWSTALWEREASRAGHTTHFSVVDAAGNAVANTYTINDSFGAAVTVAGGYLLNNTQDDFTTQLGVPNLFGLLQSEGNTIAPGKRALSSMSPTILLRNGQLSFVTGSPGGPRIISATLLSLLNWMRLGLEAQAAINAPRFHHQWMPDELYVEETFPEPVRAALERMGHTVRVGSWIGQVEAIAIDPRTGERLGAADPRRGGVALGY
ncbi:MAG: gamma-glutamyltransferase [Firmicutes bacterium]|nr:gamma-glutamyltransferase [Bacillota bacterium]